MAAWAIFLALGVLFTWPVLRHMDATIVGAPGDNLGAVHTLYWFWHEVSQFHIPWSIDLYAVPRQSVVFHPSPVMEVISLPITGLFGAAVSYNSLSLLSYAACGYTSFVLVRRLVDSDVVAICAGALFTATGPHQFNFLFNTNAVWALPLLALALLRWRENPRRWWEVAVAGSVLALSNFYFVVYYVPIVMACFFPWRRILQRFVLTGFLASGAAIVAICAAVYIPPLLAVGDTTRGELRAVAALPDSRPPTEVLGLVIGSPHHPLLGGLFTRAGAHLDPAQAPNTGSAYLGIVILILAGFGLRPARRTGPWLPMAVAGGLMMLGPALLVAGHRIMPLPYTLIERVPVLNYLRAPGRFYYVVSLALVVMAAFGMRRLLGDRTSGTVPNRGRMAAVGLIAALGVFEMLFEFPRPTTDARVPAVYARLATLPGDPIVIEAPGGSFNDYQWLSYQRDSGLRVVNDASPRASLNDPILLYTNAFLRQTAAGPAPYYGPEPSAIPADEAEFAATGRVNPTRRAAMTELERAGVGYAILHRQTLFAWRDANDPGFASYSAFLERYLGPAVYEDSAVRIFAFPNAPGRNIVKSWRPSG